MCIPLTYRLVTRTPSVSETSSRMSFENVFEQHEPLINEPDTSTDSGDLPLESNDDISYIYSFKIDAIDRELDITVTDSSVVVISSANERKPPPHPANVIKPSKFQTNSLIPSIQLSAMVSIPDDADAATVKVNVVASHLIIKFDRCDKLVRGRKLFVQAD